jgi:three-Cys-motif partner protein
MSDQDSNYDEREQSEIKHYVLRLYLEAATRIIGTTRHIRYVDCCAGPWEERSTEYRDTSFGIAVPILQLAAGELRKRNLSPRFSCLLIEKKITAFAKLEKFAAEHNSVELPVAARNWNFTERLEDIVRFCSSPGAFPFIFIDPTGWQLAGISKIRPLLKLNPGEVLINLMSPFIGRFIKDNKTDFSDLLGADFPLLRDLSGPELESAIVAKYCEIIKREGDFGYVCSLPIMNPDMDSFNFHLIYATRHIKGVQVFKDVEKRTAEMTHALRAELQQKDRQARSGNFELFSPDVQYKETSYQRLEQTNKKLAKDAVWSLIETKSQAAYDACWGEALQFSAVYEADLRNWISTWQRDGLIRVEGKPSKARVLQVGNNIRLIRTSGA